MMWRFGLSSRAIFLSIAALLVFHFITIFMYTEIDRAQARQAKLDSAIEKIVDIVHILELTPEVSHSKVIKAYRGPDFEVALEDQPHTGLHVDARRLWRLTQTLQPAVTERHFEVAIQLPAQRWLNVKAEIHSGLGYLQFLLLGVELFVAGVILSSAWAMARFSMPLQHFKEIADGLGVDMKSEPLRIESGPAIVRETAQAMHNMQNRIRGLIRDRTQMLAAISHDLRTPITRMQLRVQMMADVDLAQQLRRDLDDMADMITHVLTFIREGRTEAARTKLDISSLLLSMTDDMQEMGGGVTFDAPDEHAIVAVDALALKRALQNILNNALVYGNNAEVNMQIEEQRVIIGIRDHGPGIPDEQLQDVLKPFYRGEPSRSKETGGVGLGLAIADTIIRAHHGRMTLTNHPAGGLLVEVMLPRCAVAS